MYFIWWYTWKQNTLKLTDTWSGCHLSYHPLLSLPRFVCTFDACSLKLFPKMVYTLHLKQDLNLGRCKIAVFKDYQATMLTPQPPELDTLSNFSIISSLDWKFNKNAFHNFKESIKVTNVNKTSFKCVHKSICMLTIEIQ